MQTIVHRSRTRAWLAAPAAALLTALALSGPAAAATATLGGSGPTVVPTHTSLPGVTSQGIIMKDGSPPCDPITKRGCE
jgi:hypothetical protein